MSEMLIVLWLVSAAFYMLPTIIASIRNNRNTAAIGVLNFFLGWTGIGWIGALVWALTNPATAARA
jgi:hypothetical protein